MSDQLDNDYVRVFDTTLRDGEQSPGATLDTADKLEVAHQLAKLGVDVIEAGFPAASPGDLDAVQRVADAVGKEDGPIIAGLARCTRKDIDAAWEGVREAAKPRIHTFIATSDLHLEHKLRMTRAKVLERIREMVGHAAGLCDDVEFSPEDASRTDPAFLYESLAAAVEAGATTLNIPDTVGYAVPAEYGRMIQGILENVPGVDRCIVSVHCHDDLGLAVANTLAGVEAGARQMEVTLNGIGERAGNAALEEVVMALHTRRSVYGLRTGIDTPQLSRTSHLVAMRTGIFVPPNKAVVGANAFAHEAGIHQDGVLKHQMTYEIMEPETVGVVQSRVVRGKRSGRHAFRKRLEEMGYTSISEAALDRAFKRFKKQEEKKRSLVEADFEALVADEFYQPPKHFEMHGVHVSSGTPSIPSASISITTIGRNGYQTATSTGTGPVDAIFGAINKVVNLEVQLEEYIVHAVTGGIDALGEVTVRVRTVGDAPRSASGHGADTDILVASARAYLSALNKLAAVKGLTTPMAAAPPAADQVLCAVEQKDKAED